MFLGGALNKLYTWCQRKVFSEEECGRCGKTETKVDSKMKKLVVICEKGCILCKKCILKYNQATLCAGENKSTITQQAMNRWCISLDCEGPLKQEEIQSVFLEKLSKTKERNERNAKKEKFKKFMDEVSILTKKTESCQNDSTIETLQEQQQTNYYEENLEYTYPDNLTKNIECDQYQEPYQMQYSNSYTGYCNMYIPNESNSDFIITDNIIDDNNEHFDDPIQVPLQDKRNTDLLQDSYNGNFFVADQTEYNYSNGDRDGDGDGDGDADNLITSSNFNENNTSASVHLYSYPLPSKSCFYCKNKDSVTPKISICQSDCTMCVPCIQRYCYLFIKTDTCLRCESRVYTNQLREYIFPKANEETKSFTSTLQSSQDHKSSKSGKSASKASCSSQNNTSQSYSFQSYKQNKEIESIKNLSRFCNRNSLNKSIHSVETSFARERKVISAKCPFCFSYIELSSKSSLIQCTSEFCKGEKIYGFCNICKDRFNTKGEAEVHYPYGHYSNTCVRK